MSYMQCNSHGMSILAMALHMMHTLLIATLWSSSMTCPNVLSGRSDGVFWEGIVSVKEPEQTGQSRALKLILCDRWSTICLHTTDHIDTTLLVVWQHRYSTWLLRHAVTSNHVPTLWEEPCFVPLPADAHQTKTDRDKPTKKTLMCFISYEHKRNSEGLQQWFNYFYFTFSQPGSHTEIKDQYLQARAGNAERWSYNIPSYLIIMNLAEKCNHMLPSTSTFFRSPVHSSSGCLHLL